SGHTTTAFAVGIAAALAAPARWRRVVAAGAFVYGTTIGVATIAAGWHRPSDVAGALLVVTGWAAAVVLVVVVADRGAFGRERRRAPRRIDRADEAQRRVSSRLRRHRRAGGAVACGAADRAARGASRGAGVSRGRSEGDD